LKAVEAGGSVKETEIPAEAALLPFEEKAKYVVELRRKGKTYREIQRILKISPRDVKRALKLEAHRDEIQELRERVEDVAKSIGRLESKLKSVDSKLAEVGGVLEWLERSLDRRFREDSSEVCTHMDRDGYCVYWTWKSPVKGWSMKKLGDRYALNVKAHRWVCALCPSFTTKDLKDAVESVKALWEAFEGLSRRVNQIPILNLYEDFTCSSCGSKHLIAVKFKCTNCGYEGWWGYWPKKP